MFTDYPNRPLILWLLSGCLLIFIMVIIGGITRLTHSGLSITEWNLLMGTLPPLNEYQWQELFEKYRQSPEFIKVHSFFTISDFKSIFWWEYIHRLLGRLIGIVFIIPFFYFLFKKKISRELLPRLIVIFLLGALQGVLGWYMVKSGLVDIPAVSHYRLAAHLFTAFATFGYTLWVVLELTRVQPLISGSSPPPQQQDRTLFHLALFVKLLFALIMLQIIYGAFVAGLKAGYLYPTFPRMGTEWIAEEIIMNAEQYGLISFLNEAASVQFVHRWIGIIILVFSVVLWIFFRKKEIPPNLQLSLRILLIIVMLQFALGLLTLINSVPIDLAILHQAGAFILFGTVIWLLFEIRLSNLKK